MKKTLALVTALLLLFLLAACSQKDDVQYFLSKRQITHETGDVNLTTFLYDENRNILSSETLLNGVFASRVDYTYSEDGTVVTQDFTSATSEPSSSEIHSTYDENGKVTSASSYSNGRLIGTTYYTYDEHGREIKLESFDPDGKPLVTITHAYDQNGNLLSTSNHYGTYVSQTDHTYDSKGHRLTTETRINDQLNFRVEYIWNKNMCYGTVYSPEGTPMSKTLTVQDDHGNILLEESYDVLGTFTGRTCYEYIGTNGKISSGFPEE